MHLHIDHGSPLRHGRPHRGPLQRERQRRFKATKFAGVYPWSDPAWRYRLYGAPHPCLYYRPAGGYELLPDSVGKKLCWRRVFRGR